jgi:hypothetical protein
MTPLRPVRVAQNRVLEGLTGFHWLLFPVFVLQCIYYANYRGRARRVGWLIAVPLELLRGLFTVSAHGYAFHYQEAIWTPAQLARFLKNNGVPTFGWSWVDGKAYFHVPAHLRGRADYLISRSRQPIEG